MQVHQADPGDQALRATDGRMLATILANPSYTTVSEVSALCGGLVWRHAGHHP